MENEILEILNKQINKIDEKELDLAEREKVKSTQNLNNSITFSAYKNILLKITYQKIKKFIEIRKIDDISIDELKKKFENVTYKKDELYIKIYINEEKEIEKIEGEIQKIYIFLCNNTPVETFGCCSRYIECSENLKCINPDRKLAKGCQYKNNLEQGKIFYGKNKNI